MKQKVLVIGPSFFGYNDSIKRAFEQLGYDAEVLPYDEPIHPFNWKNALLHKLFPKSKKLRTISRRKFNTQAIQYYNAYLPELVFIYNGDVLEKETILHFKPTSRVAIWMLDGAFLHPDSVKLAPLVDAYFCFEKSDVAKLTLLGVKACFLPQGYDPQVYYPITDCEKEIDILFIGTLYQYPERIRLLNLLIRELGNTYRIRVYGRYKPIFKNPIKWLFRGDRAVFANHNVMPDEVNRLYNKARLCINIHHGQSVEGANPKVFEICGAGAFQFVDYNKYIAGVYPSGEVGLYTSDSDFITKIRQYLASDLSTLASEAHRNVLANHTFTSRIQEAIQVLGLFNPAPF